MAAHDLSKPLLTIDLSDIISGGGGGEDPSSRRRLSSNSTSSGFGSTSAAGRGRGSGQNPPGLPLTSDFSSGLQFPKLPLSRDTFRNSNPSVEKLPKTPFLPRVAKGAPKKSAGNMWRPPVSESSDDEMDDTMKKVKGFLNKRRTLAPSKLDTEIHSRISKAYDSMKTLEKGVKTFDESLILAKGRAAAAASGRSIASQKSDSIDGSPRPGVTSEQTPRKPMKHVDVTRPIKSMFGLDPMKVLAMSDNENSDGDDDGEDYIEPEPRNNNVEVEILGERIDPTLREIPTLGDKRFLNRHHKRERRLTKELSGMKNQLEVLNMRTESESESRRHRLKRVVAHANIERPRNLTRLMAYDPKKGPAKELTDYLQSTGGTTGGWDHDDHSVFMRSYTKWKHYPSKVIDYVATQCPGKKLEDVAKHLTWFEKYDKLNKANKAFVRQWQVDKRREHETMFQMAAQNHRAQIEGQKSRQEMIRAKREEEKERERIRLETWKKARPDLRKKTDFNAMKKTEGPSETLKLAAGMKASKERVLSVIPSTHQLHKILTKTTSSSSVRPKVLSAVNKVKVEEPNEELLSPPDSPPASSRGSSGIFSDQEVDSDYERQLELGIGDMPMSNYEFLHSDSEDEEGKGEPNAGPGGDSPRIKLKNIKEKMFKMVEFSPDDDAFKSQHQQRGANKKVIAMYQAKDAAMIHAKRQAILDKKERQRNKSFLSSDQAKERIGKIDIPSHVFQLTKGLKMRKNIRDLDVLETAGREARKNDKDLYHNVSRVPSPRMFQSAPNIKLIPKLGATGWRQY